MEKMSVRPCLFDVSQTLTVLTVSYKHFTNQKTFKFAKLIALCFENIYQSKYSQKLMSRNSKTEIFEN